MVDVERADVDVRDVVSVELVKVRWLRNILWVELSSRFLQQKVFINQRYGAVRLFVERKRKLIRFYKKKKKLHTNFKFLMSCAEKRQ